MSSVKKLMIDSAEELKSFDWNDLGDIESIGVWPGIVKLVLGVALFAACLGGGYWFHVKNLQDSLAQVAAQELDLRSDLETKAVLAANLEPYRQQMRDMEELFGFLLRRLPGATEVPDLLDDITVTGLGSGIEFSSILPESERRDEYYTELPIKIAVSGGYHDFGTFVSGVANLSRIVTLHDFDITSGANPGELNMNILAKTYRYNSEDE